MDKEDGYGTCDELGTGSKCDTCDVHDKTGEHGKAHGLTPVEDIKTQPVRIRITDLDVLHHLKESEDETPGAVIHRVLTEYNNLKHGNQNAAQQFNKELNVIIENQMEEIKTLRREIGERNAAIEDIKGESLLENEIEELEELPTHEIHMRGGTTVNIYINDTVD